MLALFKHAKNFVSKNDSRPIFEGICFDGKRAIVTNTHLMIIVNDIPFEPQIIHWKTGEKIAGDYPSVDKVIPPETVYNIEFTDICELLKIVKIALAVTSNDFNHVGSIEGDKLQVNYYQLKFEAKLPAKVLNDECPKVFLNLQYFYNILAFFKDAGVHDFKFGLNTRLQPIKLTTDKNVLAVLTPVRAE